MNASGKVRIILADDHEVVRRGMAAILEGYPGMHIVGEVGNGRSAVALAVELAPDVVVMDVGMEEMNGFEATRRIRRLLPKTEVLVLTMHYSEQLVREVIAAGARGYVLKSDAGRQLLEAVQAVAQQRPYFTSEMARRIYGEAIAAPTPGRPAASGLTPREREITQLLVEGRNSREIAERLGLSPRTVETHRANIKRKTGAKTLPELVHYAVRDGIVAAPLFPPLFGS